MRAKIKKNNLIILGLVFLLIIIVVGQSSTAFIGAAEQPNKEGLDKVLREVNQMIIDNFDLMSKKQAKLRIDIDNSFIGNDVRRAAINNIDEIKRVMLTENKKVNALIKDMKDMKEGKIKFDNNKIKAHLVGIRQDAIKIRNLLGHTEIVRNPSTGAVTTIRHGFDNLIFTIMDAPAKKELVDAKTELTMIMNQVAFYQNGIVPIAPPVRPPTNAQIKKINELKKEAMEKEAEERKLEEELGIGKKGTSISLINLLAQGVRMNNPPSNSKDSDPKTEAEAAELIERLKKENAARAARIQQLKDRIKQRQDSMDDAQSDGADPLIDDPFVVSDGEIKISKCKIDEKTGICTITVQICSKKRCYPEETMVISLFDLADYYDKEDPNKVPLEEYILDKIDPKFKDFVLQPPFDNLEQKLADKIKERDAKVAEKIKILTDLVTLLGKNWQEIYPDIDSYFEDLNKIKEQLDSLKKK